MAAAPTERAKAMPVDDDAPANAGTFASLMWPPGLQTTPGPDRLGPRTIADLDLSEIVRALTGGDGGREQFVMAVMAELCTDPAVISYRQAVISDLLHDPLLRSRLSDVRPTLAALVQARTARQLPGAHISEVARRVEELERYVQAIQALSAALEPADPRSSGLQMLRTQALARTHASKFQTLAAALPELRATLDRIGSVTVGINFTRDLTPDSATILSITSEKVEGRGPFLERLFGKKGPKGIAPLFRVDVNSFQSPLFRELRALLEAVVGPVQEALGMYASLNTRELNDLERELAFCLHATELCDHLRRAGLPACQAQIAPIGDRITHLEQGYNASLALRMIGQPWSHPPEPESQHRPGEESAETSIAPEAGVVTNTIAFDADHARIWILTGPNRGGKTTYTRAVGQAHVLFQAGLPVPAERAVLSPVDAIYTHFPAPESEQLGTGKLDEEAERLAQIFRVATPHGLILLNEVLAGTSAVEALGLAIDAVCALRLLGVRAIYTTHLHELPASVDEINAATGGGSLVGSLVAGVEDAGAGQAIVRTSHRRTFRIQPGPPRNVSYASEIAEQHGISFAQLRDLFRRRGLDLEYEPAPEMQRRHAQATAHD